MSEDGRTARDVLLGLVKTCRKLGISFYRYLGDRLRVPGAPGYVWSDISGVAAGA